MDIFVALREIAPALRTLMFSGIHQLDVVWSALIRVATALKGAHAEISDVF